MCHSIAEYIANPWHLGTQTLPSQKETQTCWERIAWNNDIAGWKRTLCNSLQGPGQTNFIPLKERQILLTRKHTQAALICINTSKSRIILWERKRVCPPPQTFMPDHKFLEWSYTELEFGSSCASTWTHVLCLEMEYCRWPLAMLG